MTTGRFGVGGDNTHGQLGKMTREIKTRPSPLFQNVIKISASKNQTLILCEKGVIYSMGNNMVAQCGKLDLYQYSKPLTLNNDYIDIAAFNNIALAQTSENEFYAWGLYKFEMKSEMHYEDKKDQKKGKKQKKIIQEKDENGEKIEEREGKLRDVIRFLIIPEPKNVRCSSIDHFVQRYSSLTYHTVKNDACLNIVSETVIEMDQRISRQLGNLQEDDPKDLLIDHEEFVDFEQGTSIQFGNSLENDQDEPMIDPKEFVMIEYYPDKEKDKDKDKEENSTINNIHIGDQNKFSAFKNSPIQTTADITLSNLEMTGKKTMLEKVKEMIN